MNPLNASPRLFPSSTCTSWAYENNNDKAHNYDDNNACNVKKVTSLYWCQEEAAYTVFRIMTDQQDIDWNLLAAHPSLL